MVAGQIGQKHGQFAVRIVNTKKEELALTQDPRVVESFVSGRTVWVLIALVDFVKVSTQVMYEYY